MSGVPKTSPITGRTQRTQDRVIIMAMICYSDRLQSKTSKGKSFMRENPEETRCKFPRVLFQWSHTEFILPAMNYDNTYGMSSSLETQRLGFLVRLVIYHPLPAIYQNSRLPLAKQVLCINHIICATNLGTVSHSYQFWEL